MPRIIKHIFFWTVMTLWSSTIVDWHNIVSNCGSSFISNLIYIARRLPIIMFSSYLLVNYILPKYLIENKSIGLFASIFSTHFIITNVVDRFYIAFWDTYGGNCSKTFWETVFHYEAIFRNAIILISILGLHTIIKFFKYLLQQKELNNQLVVENLETKHAFLRSQVSPHFLFNALNNIYSMSVQSKEEKLSTNISNLSGIMKYLTYESNQDFVPLEKEIQLIKDYISIQQLRMDESDNVIISFNTEGNINSKHIAPVILLPLVENCFKHGIIIGKKCLIVINLKIEAKNLTFHTRNYNYAQIKNSSIIENGVGLVNVKKRLDLIYPERHEFDNHIDDGFYNVQLNITLKS